QENSTTVRAALTNNSDDAASKEHDAHPEQINDHHDAKRETRDIGEINLIETAGGFEGAGEDDERQGEALNEAGEQEERLEVAEDVTVNGKEARSGINRDVCGENDQKASAEVIVESR